MTEKELHSQICRYIKHQYPDVIFNTDLSGIKLTMGQAVQVKHLRSSRGIPDIVIYVPNASFHALFLEVKKESPYKINGELKRDEHIQEQMAIINKLSKLGYMAMLVWTFETAKKIIDEYLR